jgi:hypothetical protein
MVVVSVCVCVCGGGGGVRGGERQMLRHEPQRPTATTPRACTQGPRAWCSRPALRRRLRTAAGHRAARPAPAPASPAGRGGRAGLRGAAGRAGGAPARPRRWAKAQPWAAAAARARTTATMKGAPRPLVSPPHPTAPLTAAPRSRLIPLPQREPNSEHLRFPGHRATFGGARAAWRGPVGPNRPWPEGGVVGWPVRAAPGSSKMTGRPNLFQIGRPTRASSRSAHSAPARSRSPTLVPAHVRARACGVWRPSFRALTKAHRPMQDCNFGAPRPGLLWRLNQGLGGPSRRRCGSESLAEAMQGQDLR